MLPEFPFSLAVGRYLLKEETRSWSVGSMGHGRPPHYKIRKGDKATTDKYTRTQATGHHMRQREGHHHHVNTKATKYNLHWSDGHTVKPHTQPTTRRRQGPRARTIDYERRPHVTLYGRSTDTGPNRNPASFSSKTASKGHHTNRQGHHRPHRPRTTEGRKEKHRPGPLPGITLSLTLSTTYKARSFYA